MQCQRNFWKSGYGDRSGKYLVVQQKIHLFSATNYFANVVTNLGQDCP